MFKKTQLFSVLLVLFVLPSFGQNRHENGIQQTMEAPGKAADSVQWGVDYLNKLLYSNGEWYITDRTLRKSIRTLVNHSQDMPIDSSLVKMESTLDKEQFIYLFDRRPSDIRDFSVIPGYVMPDQLVSDASAYQSQLVDSLKKVELEIPQELKTKAQKEVYQLPGGDALALYDYDNIAVHDEFRDMLRKKFSKNNILDSVSTVHFDSIRRVFADSLRLDYNLAKEELYLDSLTSLYQSNFISTYVDSALIAYKAKINEQNKDIAYQYNDSVVERTNKDLKQALFLLTDNAKKDSIYVSILNKDGSTVGLWTNNLNDPRFIRHYIKNEQNDSLGVLLFNEGKGRTKIIIDDAVTFQHFTEAQNRDVVLNKPKLIDKTEFIHVKKETPEASPWDFGGYVNFGLTQTALANWAAGGESSVSALGIGNYYVNYKTTTDSWENSIDVRYGTQRTEENGYQKNDDKIEFNTRYGTSAFKKWFYSVESNFKTQMAIGWEDSEKETKVSQWMAPGYWTTAIGMDYKPNNDFSMFLSPLTAKATFVSKSATSGKDSIDETRYGLDEGSNALWQPGFIMKLNYKKTLMENIALETSGEFFANYNDVFNAVDMDLEAKITMQVNQYINAQILCNVIYDDDVEFDTGDLDADGNAITENRFQVKEVFTIGFTYKFY